MMFGLLTVGAVWAQTTGFTYQGRLTDSSVPANGSYDFEFALFNANTAGTQLGSTLTLTGVNVAAGVFTVELDFGSAPFLAGAERFLEIRVKKSIDPSYMPLAPRQRITGVPFGTRVLSAATADAATTAINADQLGGVSAANYLQVNGDGSGLINLNAANLNGVVPISSGGTGSTTQNFVDLNSTQIIAGNKTFSNAVDTSTQYNIGGSRVLSNAGSFNLFAGVNAGSLNTTGAGNSFFGRNAGQNNTVGFNNSFVGASAGQVNTTGGNNSFFGTSVGFSNTTGGNNSFFGAFAGNANTTGSSNSFFGEGAGQANTTSGSNSFFGTFAGQNNTTGAGNSFFGAFAGNANTTGGSNSFYGIGAGESNTTGSNNTILGNGANVGANNLLFATAIGSNAIVNTSDTIVLGKTAGSYNSTLRPADTVRIPGDLVVIGTLTGTIDGSTVTNLNASNITSGTLDNARLGVVPIANGGTGSATQNFVDLTTAQTVAGVKTFSSPVNALTQYNIGGNRVLSSPSIDNLFAGFSTGIANTTGNDNSFFGNSAGTANTTGIGNSFFGRGAGIANTNGDDNTFIGRSAGKNNTTGNNNIFIGNSSGNINTATQVSNSITIGNNVSVSASNTIIIGSTTQKTIISGGFSTNSSLNLAGSGYMETFFLSNQLSGIYTPNVLFSQYANNPLGSIRPCVIFQGITNAFGVLLTNCQSPFASRDKKTDLQPFTGGLEIIKRLQPVAFKYKENGKSDIGLNTEDIAEIEPTLIQRDENLSVEEVNETKLTVLFINAIKEQQKLIEAQQRQIDGLKKLVCAANPNASVCQEEQK